VVETNGEWVKWVKFIEVTGQLAEVDGECVEVNAEVPETTGEGPMREAWRSKEKRRSLAKKSRPLEEKGALGLGGGRVKRTPRAREPAMARGSATSPELATRRC
jgi:hypothetical protein